MLHIFTRKTSKFKLHRCDRTEWRRAQTRRISGMPRQLICRPRRLDRRHRPNGLHSYQNRLIPCNSSFQSYGFTFFQTSNHTNVQTSESVTFQTCDPATCQTSNHTTFQTSVNVTYFHKKNVKI